MKMGIIWWLLVLLAGGVDSGVWRESKEINCPWSLSCVKCASRGCFYLILSSTNKVCTADVGSFEGVDYGLVEPFQPLGCVFWSQDSPPTTPITTTSPRTPTPTVKPTSSTSTATTTPIPSPEPESSYSGWIIAGLIIAGLSLLCILLPCLIIFLCYVYYLTGFQLGNCLRRGQNVVGRQARSGRMAMQRIGERARELRRRLAREGRASATTAERNGPFGGDLPVYSARENSMLEETPRAQVELEMQEVIPNRTGYEAVNGWGGVMRLIASPPVPPQQVATSSFINETPTSSQQAQIPSTSRAVAQQSQPQVHSELGNSDPNGIQNVEIEGEDDDVYEMAPLSPQINSAAVLPLDNVEEETEQNSSPASLPIRRPPSQRSAANKAKINLKDWCKRTH